MPDWDTNEDQYNNEADYIDLRLPQPSEPPRRFPIPERRGNTWDTLHVSIWHDGTLTIQKGGDTTRTWQLTASDVKRLAKLLVEAGTPTP